MHFYWHTLYKEFEAEILDLQSEKYGLSFDIKKYTTSSWALGDENVIGIRAFMYYVLFRGSVNTCDATSSYCSKNINPSLSIMLINVWFLHVV